MRVLVGLLFGLAVATTGGADEPRRAYRDFDLVDSFVDATWAASRVDCYFTLQELNSDPRRYPQGEGKISSQRIRVRKDVASVEELIADLRAGYKGAVVHRDPRNSAVIHIIQQPLAEEKENALISRIDFSFDGTPTDLSKALLKTFGRVGPPGGSTTLLQYEHDVDTKIRVRAKARACDQF